MRTVRYVASFIVGSLVAVVAWNSGCSSQNNGGPSDGGDDSTGSGSGGSNGGGTSSGSLVTYDGPTSSTGGSTTKDGKISTYACTGKGDTSITGKVFDPAGKNPVYNAAVWVPYTQPDAMKAGLTCNCSELYTGGYVGAYALTDATGAFKIDPAPAPMSGSGSVPFVVQVGKWRYQTQVGVTCGMENKVPDGNLRLPQGAPGTGVQFAGDLPHMAISTGDADTLECLLTRMGVAESEYVPGSPPTGAGGQHIHIYTGGNNCAPSPIGSPVSSQSLWDTAAHLAAYDAVLLSCEGAPTKAANPNTLMQYGQMGGRVFASHYHYQWFLGNPFPNLGTWFTNYANQLNNPTYGVVQTMLANGRPFPQGQAMQTWLQTVGALDSSNELEIYQARHNVDVTYNNFPNGISWMQFDPAKATFPMNVTYDPVTANSTLYFSYDVAGGNNAETSCGRFVYSDLHVGGNSGDYGEGQNSSSPPCGRTDVPSGCNSSADLSAQEKALEFMLFDLTQCLAPPGSPDAGVIINMAK